MENTAGADAPKELPTGVGGQEICAPTLDEIEALFQNPDTPIERVFDAQVAYQIAQRGIADAMGVPLEDGPCAEVQAQIDGWTEDPGGDWVEDWKAARNRALGAKPAPVDELQKINDAILLGDQHTPEAQAALATPITIMHAPTRLTPGNKWAVLEETVGGLIQNYMSRHWVAMEKDGRAVVYAKGQKAGKVTSSGKVTQYAYRVQDKIEAMTAFAVDIDGTDKARRVADRIHEVGYMGLVYTTHSHHAKRTKDGDRFRVVVFLAEPFTFPMDDDARRRQAVDEWHSRYAGVCELLGLEEIDGTSLNLHQMQYSPRRASEDAPYEHYIVAGGALRVEDMPLGDASKYRKKGPSRGAGKVLTEKDYAARNRPSLSDGFELLDWYLDGGRHVLFAEALDMIGWDTRGEMSNGWVAFQCPNAAQHSDPEDDEAGFKEGEDGFVIHCFHDHCSALRTLDFVVLIEAAIERGEAVLPDEYNRLSALLCDPALYPEIDGEELEFDPRDYGLEEGIEIGWLSNAKQVERAFKKVTEDSHAGDDHFAALYAGVEKAGNKTRAVDRLGELIEEQGRFDGNARKRLAARGSQLLKEDRAAYAAQQSEERRKNAEEALDRVDLDNPSMDPAEPLGDDLESSLATLRRRYAPCDLGGKFRIVRKPDLSAFNSDFDSTIVVYTKQDFLDLHLDRQLVDGDALIDPAKEFLGLEKRKSGLVFAPPPLVPGPNDFNMYQGRKLEAKAGKWPTLERFIRDIVCNGDDVKYEWLMLWMAHMVQFPGVKPGTAVIATGSGGVGKGTMGAILMKLAAPHTKQLENESHVVGQFAGEHLSKCVLVVVNEAVFGANPRVSSTLKSHVDSTGIQVEAKGMNLTTVPSYMRFYFDSNDAVPVLIENNGSERRYFVLRFSDARKQDLAYFKEVRAAIEGDEMRALLAYLEEYEPPATAGLTWEDVRTAPETTERVLMGVHSMRGPKSRLRETLIEGQVTLLTPEGLETFTAGDETEDNGGLRVPQALFRDYIGSAGDKRRAEDRDIPAMFAQLFPEAELGAGQGKVGKFDNTRWWLFPAETLGEGG